MESGPVGFQRQKVVAATPDDLFRYLDLGSHGVNGDERSRQIEPFEQQRNGDDFVGFLVNGLLDEDEALTGRPCRVQRRRFATLAARVGSLRCLGVDGDDVRRALAQRFDPAREGRS